MNPHASFLPLARPRTLAVALACLSSFSVQSAEACGGFFCSAASPVNQAAERIIFAQDGDGNVTQIVEVMYEGDAEKFAWVLPVPGTPTPGVSSVQAFDRLQQATNPTYQLNNVFPDSCDGRSGSVNSGGDGDGVSLDGEGDGGPKVIVLDSGSVGPFDYETISVDAADQEPADVALEWLNANGYDLGERAADVLGPYLANGLNLIAFRLQKGASAGSIRPISLKYKAKYMSIPIRPTAVAAADDMPIMVWVLGKNRAVPTNYRGLEINDLLIDWITPNDTYNQVVTAAAKEAGGQGFVTELAAAAETYEQVISPDWETIEPSNYQGGSLEDNLIRIVGEYGAFDGFVDVVREHLDLRGSVTPEKFVECPYCYFYPGDSWTEGYGGSGTVGDVISPSDPIYTTNTGAFLAAVQADVLGPIKETAALFGQFDYVTRLYTTMSASDMTLDPEFKFNPDAGDVSNVHVATRNVTCDGPSGKWKVTLPSGQVVYGEGSAWPYSLANSDLPANMRILQYSTSGEPEVITDNSARIQAVHTSSPASEDNTSSKTKDGCAMRPGPEKSPLAWLALGVLGTGLLLRRRRGQA